MKKRHTVIRGSCPLFVCRYCRTKFGRQHQEWCEILEQTEPVCGDCSYFIQPENECRHPALKRERRDLRYEEDKRPL